MVLVTHFFMIIVVYGSKCTCTGSTYNSIMNLEVTFVTVSKYIECQHYILVYGEPFVSKVVDSVFIMTITPFFNYRGAMIGRDVSIYTINICSADESCR